MPNWIIATGLGCLASTVPELSQAIKQYTYHHRIPELDSVAELWAYTAAARTWLVIVDVRNEELRRWDSEGRPIAPKGVANGEDGPEQQRGEGEKV